MPAKKKAAKATDRRSVREKTIRTGGKPSHIDKPSRATGRRAERIAAREVGESGEVKARSPRRKKSNVTVESGARAGKKSKSRKKSATH